MSTSDLRRLQAHASPKGRWAAPTQCVVERFLVQMADGVFYNAVEEDPAGRSVLRGGDGRHDEARLLKLRHERVGRRRSVEHDGERAVLLVQLDKPVDDPARPRTRVDDLDVSESVLAGSDATEIEAV